MSKLERFSQNSFSETTPKNDSEKMNKPKDGQA